MGSRRGPVSVDRAPAPRPPRSAGRCYRQQQLDLPGTARRPHGLEAWAQVTERGSEGLVAKDEASVYVGGRTRAWLKVEQKAWTVEEDRSRRRISSDNAGGWHLVVESDDETIRNLLLGLTSLLI